MNLKPQNLSELQAIVHQASPFLPRGGATKTALSTPAEGVAALDLSSLSGMLEYEPGEYVFSARAGTPVAEIVQVLAAHGQYLPFDPLFVEGGATLGGTVAANTAGPGRYHYGGLRDFLIGVRFVDTNGQLVRGGGKVVKNSAGFDLPKLMVGSLGCYGILAELTFKVFPRPQTYATLQYDLQSLDQAFQVMHLAGSSKIDLDAIDFMTGDQGIHLWIRLAGLQAAMPARLQRLQSVAGSAAVLVEDDDERLWAAAREMAWMPAGWSLVKVPLTPGKVPALEAALLGLDDTLQRRYSAGGQVAWLAMPGDPGPLDPLLSNLGLSGLVILGSPRQQRLGMRTGEAFARRVKTALDPAGRFVEA